MAVRRTSGGWIIDSGTIQPVALSSSHKKGLLKCLRGVLPIALLGALLPGPLAAQTRPATLSTLFEDVFGPNGLVVSSDDVQLDGTNHAAHFNSSFQSDFRLMNIALATQLTTVPVPSPASGFIYKFDSATGTFVRATRSFGPILADRAETIGRDRIAFSFNDQVFSFDKLDGVPLSGIPAVFRHDAYQTHGRPIGRHLQPSTRSTHPSPSSRERLTYGVLERFDVSLAVPVVRTRLSLLSNATVQRVGTGPQLQIHYFRDDAAPGGHGTSQPVLRRRECGRGSGICVVRGKGTLMREGDPRPRGRSRPSDSDRQRGKSPRRRRNRGASVRRVLGDLRTDRAAREPRVSVERQQHSRRGHPHRAERGPARSVRLRVGSDFSVNARLSVVFDVVGQRVINSPRLTTFAFDATGPFGSAALEDLRFQNAWYWGSSGSVGTKLNVAPRVLINFNLRFALTEGGLTDRVSPLIGAEFAF